MEHRGKTLRTSMIGIGIDNVPADALVAFQAYTFVVCECISSAQRTVRLRPLRSDHAESMTEKAVLISRHVDEILQMLNERHCL